MRSRAESASLQDDKSNRANNGNEVERKVHQVPYYGIWCELGERPRDKLAQFAYRVAPRLDLALCGDERGLASGEQCSIKGVDEGIVNEEVLAQDVEDGRRFTEDEQDGAHDGKRTIEQGEEGDLGQIGDCEHEDRHAHTERHGG